MSDSELMARAADLVQRTTLQGSESDLQAVVAALKEIQEPLEARLLELEHLLDQHRAVVATLMDTPD